jgi:hypothetical protein
MTRNRPDVSTIGMLLTAYTIVCGLFALWFYSFFVPARSLVNPGLAAYKPPPATVIDYQIPTRVEPPQQVPPPVEAESQPEQPTATGLASTGTSSKVVEHSPERIIDVKKPPRPKSAASPRERNNPLDGYAAARSGQGGAPERSRYHGAGAYQGYLGDRLF